MKSSFLIFFMILFWRPHRAVEIMYWYATNRKLRARNRLRAVAAAAPFAYQVLIHSIERQDEIIAAAPAMIASWEDTPLFSIIAEAPSARSRIWLRAAIKSVQRQCYGRWELLLFGNGATSYAAQDPRVRVMSDEMGQDRPSWNDAIDRVAGEFIVPLTEGTLLSALALFRFAEALQSRPDAEILYGDEDGIARGHRSSPWLKPAWNAEMFLALDFASRGCAIATAGARAAKSSMLDAIECPVFALFLAVTRSSTVDPVHVEHIVVHVQRDAATNDAKSRARVVQVQHADEAITAEPGAFGTVIVRWPMPAPEPSISILIPTRDKVDLLAACIGSILNKTEYKNYQIIIIDNGSTETETHEYFATVDKNPKISVLPCAMPYNYSAINNYAVDRSQDDFVCFLNNDTEIIDGRWLGELMRYAVRPSIGAVGAKLLYADLSIQHAGVVLGIGNAAGHAHRNLPDGDIGYFAQAHVPHYASAVTAACMVVERRKFLDAGGFDERELQIAYNDVDLCLKLQHLGWRNVYAPQAVLLHLESKSRGSDFSAAHLERYMRELAVLQTRWNTTTLVDPMHHPRLDRGSEVYRINLIA